MSGEGSSPPPRQSPYSPFPFGSPLGMSSSRAGDQKNFVSSETTANGTSLSSSTTTSPSQSSAFGNSIYLKGRVRAQEAYGGKILIRIDINISTRITTRNIILYKQHCNFSNTTFPHFWLDFFLSTGGP